MFFSILALFLCDHSLRCVARRKGYWQQRERQGRERGREGERERRVEIYIKNRAVFLFFEVFLVFGQRVVALCFACGAVSVGAGSRPREHARAENPPLLFSTS